MALHYLQERKKNILIELHTLINEAGEAETTKIAAVFFEKFGICPDTTKRYLKTLEDLGKIKISEKENLISSMKRAEEIEKDLTKLKQIDKEVIEKQKKATAKNKKTRKK